MNFLTYWPNVKKTPAITRAVGLLDPYFEGEPSEISSGWRAPMDQLRLIMEKAKRHGIDNDFGEFKQPHLVDVEMREPEVMALVDNVPLYWWQRTWSKLVGRVGDIVNPPFPAIMLEDYISNGRNKKGEVIQISPHMHGLAFDIAGGKSLLEKSKRVLKAFQSGECFISNYRIENVNNAVHVDVQQIG